MKREDDEDFEKNFPRDSWLSVLSLLVVLAAFIAFVVWLMYRVTAL